MKRTVVLILAVATLAFPAAQANAGSSATPTIAQFKALQKQVKALQTQVKTLQKWVTCTTKTCFTLRQVSGLADFTYGVNICENAVLADEFQATWNVIDQISAATQAGKTYFGAQTRIDDKGACAGYQVTRPTIVPPNVAIFSSLVTLLTT